MKVKNIISDIISPKSIPQELALFEKTFSKLFKNIYFDEYIIINSSDNKAVEHILHIDTDELIAVSIPGTDLRLLINYDGDNSGFWFNLSIYKGILGYIDNFKSSTLSGSLEDFYSVFSKILDVDSAYLLLKCVEEYETGTNKIEDGFNNSNLINTPYRKYIKSVYDDKNQTFPPIDTIIDNESKQVNPGYGFDNVDPD